MGVKVDKPVAVINGIPRYGALDNYSESFGFQWNRFAKTQLHASSSDRLWRTTGWDPKELKGLDILEVGSGAGRFSRVILKETRGNLYSVDYPSAVEANFRNNGGIAPERFHLAQASIYELPYPDGSFDKVLCLGVLQHTPNFDQSVRELVAKAKPGGEIVVDFYERRGWWTLLHAKYLLRPFARRLPRERLLALIDSNADWLIRAHQTLTRAGLHALTRLLPVVDISGTLPSGLSPAQLREWVVLDTFDMFSPEFDQPQRTSDVAAMMDRAGAEVTHVAPGIVRAVKRAQ